jgi:hypothetical protein
LNATGAHLWPRAAKVPEPPRATPWKVEMAHWLLTTLSTTGAL